MNTINQAAIQSNSQSASNPEFIEKPPLDNEDFASLLLKKSQTNLDINKHSLQASTTKQSLHKNPKESFQQLDQSYKIQQHYLSHSFLANDQVNHSKLNANEKVKGTVPLGLYKRIGSPQSLNKKELYEQSAFAINKLSYLDNSESISASKHTVNLAKLNDAISTFSLENNNKPTPTEVLPPNLNAQIGYTEVNEEFRDQKTIEKSALNNANLTSNAYQIDKSRLLITAHKNEQHLYIRDYVSSTKELNSKVSTLLGSIKFTVSKIFVNGKER